MCIDGSLLQNLVFMDIPVVDMSFGISKKKKKCNCFICICPWLTALPSHCTILVLLQISIETQI